MATNNSINSDIGVATGTSLNLGSSTTITGMIDDDTMATASASTAASSESIKAYVDAAGGSVEVIDTATFSSTANYELTDLSATYFAYDIICNYLLPATDNVELWLRTSTNNGSSFDSGSSNYNYVASRFEASYSSGNSSAAAQITLAQNLGNSSTRGFYGTIRLINPMDATTYTSCAGNGYFVNATGTYYNVLCGGQRESASATNAFQLRFSSGNIASGSLIVLGIKAA